MALFPNFDERRPTSAHYDATFPFCTQLFSSLRMNPSRRVMPAEYFMFVEIHFGGCGCYWQTDGIPQLPDVISATIGFR